MPSAKKVREQLQKGINYVWEDGPEEYRECCLFEYARPVDSNGIIGADGKLTDEGASLRALVRLFSDVEFLLRTSRLELHCDGIRGNDGISEYHLKTLRVTAEIPVRGDWQTNLQCEKILSLVAALGARSREGVATVVDPEEFDAQTGSKPVIHFLGTVPIVGEVN